MRKPILSLSGFCLVLSMFFAAKADGNRSTKVLANSMANTSFTSTVKTEAKAASSAEAAAMSLYDSLGLAGMGLNKEAMLVAFEGFQNLLHKGQVANPDVLTIVDFSQSSQKKRMYIIDVTRGKVLMNTYVAHGKNSGLNKATNFSNIPESLQSSLGFYVTKATYQGKHGLSLRLEGKDKGFNDLAEPRAIVVHGADYIGEHRLGSAYMGRSFGCPAVPQAVSAKVINMIKNGSTMFIYSPNEKYLNKSSVLNS